MLFQRKNKVFFNLYFQVVYKKVYDNIDKMRCVFQLPFEGSLLVSASRPNISSYFRENCLSLKKIPK